MKDPVKRGKVLTKFIMEERRIIFPQETHLSTQGYEKLKTYAFNNTFYSYFKQSYRRGLATLIRTFEINRNLCERGECQNS